MKLITLLENESIHRGLLSAHGFSAYIEFGDVKILFDLGPNDYYLENAKELNVPIMDVDILVISHGHYDHGTNIQGFLDMNDHAQVYISKYAFDQFVHQKVLKHPIGIQKPKSMDRVHLITKDTDILAGIKVIAEVTNERNILSDTQMKVNRKGTFIEDDFRHELYLLLIDGSQRVLLSGCSHKGIQNIVHQVEEREQLTLTHVIGGFHFMRYDETHKKEKEYLTAVGKEFHQKRNTIFFTCHCTGDAAYTILKDHMQDNLFPIHTGTVLDIQP